MMSSSFLLFTLLVSVQPYEAVEPHMGTLFRVKLYARNETQAQQAFQAAFHRIAQLDETLTDYQPQSELSRITQQAVGHPVTISKDLYTVIEASLKLSSETGGAFDITVGPLTHLWRQARHDQTLPSQAASNSARARCGYQKVHLDPTHQSVQFDIPGMLLDAGGIAKGYAADEALKILSRLGIHSALVAASGDLAFSDAPPGEPGWKIGIDSYDQTNKPFTRTLVLSNAAVSTSGDTEQNLKTQGKTWSHIIDPKTGQALTNELTVTTIAKTGLTADPTATAISVLGATKGITFANRSNLAAFILDKTEGQSRSYQSKAFPGDH